MHETLMVGRDLEEKQKAEAALDRRNEIDYDCFLKLSRLIPFIDDRDPEAKEEIEEAKELIRKRDRANQEYLAAITGRSRTLAHPS